MSKRISVPESGKVGPFVNLSTRYGQVVKQLSVPHDPRAPGQLACRSNLAYVARRWQFPADEQRAAWDLAAADWAVLAFLGRSTSLPGYNLYGEVNLFRMAIGLSVLDAPTALPFFSLNPASALLATNDGQTFQLKLQVLSQPVEHTLVLGASPCSPCRRCVQHFPFLGFLPAPVDGWCDLTDLFVRRYGIPAAGRAIFIRIRQHINGWNDPPKQLRTVVRAA
jgi:hypothetical protein